MTPQAWSQVRSIFKASFQSSFHYSVASVLPDGGPHVAPIGSLMLDRSEPKGVYFEIFTTQTRKNIEKNPAVCVLAVNSGMKYWLKSLMRGKFETEPAIRLHGKAGERRLATEAEIATWHRRTGFLRRLKGYPLLWGKLTYVREVTFHKIEKVKMGPMVDGGLE